MVWESEYQTLEYQQHKNQDFMKIRFKMVEYSNGRSAQISFYSNGFSQAWLFSLDADKS